MSQKKILVVDDSVSLGRQMRAMRKKIEEAKFDIEIENFDDTEYRSKIVEIDNAKTNDQKKKTLEHFADYLISMIQGWETRYKDFNLEAEND